MSPLRGLERRASLALRRGLESWRGGRYWRGKKGGQKERELSGAQQAKA